MELKVQNEQSLLIYLEKITKRSSSISKFYLFRRKFKAFFFSIIYFLMTFITILPLIFILTYLFYKGFSGFSLDFLLKNPAPVGEEGGGVANGIIGSGIIMLVAAVLSIPTGIIVGVFISEYNKYKIIKYVGYSLDLIQGTPTIIIGMFVYVLLVLPLKTFSAIAGGAALSIIMIPVICKSIIEVLQLVPHTVREAGFALGLPKWKVSLYVVLGAAKKGIITAVLLAISRVSGETAPLLFTAFGNQFFSLNPLKPIASLPLQIYNYSISPYEEWHNIAFSASLLLVLMVLGTNLIVRIFFADKN